MYTNDVRYPFLHNFFRLTFNQPIQHELLPHIHAKLSHWLATCGTQSFRCLAQLGHRRQTNHTKVNMFKLFSNFYATMATIS